MDQFIQLNAKQKMQKIMYKSLIDLAPEKLGNIFEKFSDIHTRVLRNTNAILLYHKMRTAYGQKPFAIWEPNAWNRLDSYVKLTPLIIQAFKAKLKALN